MNKTLTISKNTILLSQIATIGMANSTTVVISLKSGVTVTFKRESDEKALSLVNEATQIWDKYLDLRG